MGFFDKKKGKADDDSSMSEVLPPLPPRPSKPPPAPFGSHTPSEVKMKPLPPPPPVEDAIVVSAASIPPGSPERVSVPPPLPPKSHLGPALDAESPFGIEEAIQLMRQLPVRNVDLVMQVVKKTLESVKVDIGRIIEGANKKERGIEDRIAVLKKEIDTLETQIATSKREIGTLETEQREVSTVKERLLLAQKSEHTSESSAAERSIPSPPTRGPTGGTVSTPPARAADVNVMAKGGSSS